MLLLMTRDTSTSNLYITNSDSSISDSLRECLTYLLLVLVVVLALRHPHMLCTLHRFNSWLAFFKQSSVSSGDRSADFEELAAYPVCFGHTAKSFISYLISACADVR